MDDFTMLRSILNGTMSLGQCRDLFINRRYKRLCAALETNKYGQRDIAVLVRQILMSEKRKQMDNDQFLRVPKVSKWPDKAIWHQSGISVLNEDEKEYVIKSNEWKQSWLAVNNDYDPGKYIFSDVKRRNFNTVLGDPFLNIFKIEKYSCSGQRDAIRTILTSPAGATVQINLPTGAGKSLCVILPSMLWSINSGVSVVIVPTTSLCVDQEKAVHNFLPFPTAYYHDDSPEGRDRNREIVKRIKDGSQRIVFTSPESLTGPLKESIYYAARNGMLKMLAIDEAHMVDAWGDQFRSSFQEISGLRKDLLRIASGQLFVTVLLSATISEGSYRTLKTLFGRPGPYAEVSGVQLRPEPEYWQKYCDSDEEKRRYLLDAINNLPRPLILYFSLVKDANEWGQILRGLGYQRVDVVTGKTNSTERARIIEGWRQGSIDLVVATSAFGMGVDQNDVRVILHGCVPENLDRFYQEVGRGGRDGNASISLLIYTQNDLKIAQNLNKKVLIGINRGYERWKSMFNNGKILGPSLLRINMRTVPSFNQNDIDMDNDYNEAWNIRTLTLMARAGILELDAEQPLTFFDRLNKDQDENLSGMRVIRIINENHLSKETWINNIKHERKKKIYCAEKFNAMTEVLEHEKCISLILGKMYSIPQAQGMVIVSKSCGGCQWCRDNQKKPFAGITPQIFWSWPNKTAIEPDLARLLKGQQTLVVFYEGEKTLLLNNQKTLAKLFRWFVMQGIINLILPKELRNDTTKILSNVFYKYPFYSQDFDLIKMPKVPSLVFHTPDSKVSKLLFTSNNFGGDKNTIPIVHFLEVSTIDSKKPGCLLKDTLNKPKMMISTLISEVGL